MSGPEGNQPAVSFLIACVIAGDNQGFFYLGLSGEGLKNLWDGLLARDRNVSRQEAAKPLASERRLFRRSLLSEAGRRVS
jgi:hypothetical protein